jgi:hypothetical protein
VLFVEREAFSCGMIGSLGSCKIEQQTALGDVTLNVCSHEFGLNEFIK